MSEETKKQGNIIFDLIGVAGLGALSYGVYQIYIPAAFIVLGILLMLYAIKAS